MKNALSLCNFSLSSTNYVCTHTTVDTLDCVIRNYRIELEIRIIVDVFECVSERSLGGTRGKKNRKNVQNFHR